MEQYKKVEKEFARLTNLNHLKAIVSWDEAVMMPTGGGQARAAAISELELMMTELIQSPKLGESIKSASGEKDLSDWQLANIKEANRVHNDAKAVDPKLVLEKTMATLTCEQLWRKLRAKNNWAEFKEPFRKVVALSKEESRQRALATGQDPYEAMVNLYEPGIQLATIDKAFEALKRQLPTLIEEAIAKQARIEKVDLNRKVSIEKQKQLLPKFMKWIGFDFEHGRLDESHHPFCGGVPLDVRITTRYSEDDFLKGLMGVVHETGHAMYEQGLPKEWNSQPVGSARGMAFHESQSLFMEMQVARSREFVEYALPMLKDGLGEAGDPAQYWTVDNIYRQITTVGRTFIRVDSDEMTYPAHVILRYEMEKALIGGEIQVDDIPGVWNEKMTQYLGLSTIDNYKDGCMQDVHWPAGLFGYFPSYTLGAMTAAQLFASLKTARPKVKSDISIGNISTATNWLRDKVWSQGSKWTSEDLLKQATGEALNVEYYLKHVRERYLV